MRFLFTICIVSVGLFFSSCSKKQQIEDTDIITLDTASPTVTEEGIEEEELNEENLIEDRARPQETIESDKSVKRIQQEVYTINDGDFHKLKRFSVVISTLSKESGVNRLSNSLDSRDIDYFIVKNPRNRFYYFVISSTDSEEEALEARRQFLMANVSDQSRQDIWRTFEIELTDTYILEQRYR